MRKLIVTRIEGRLAGLVSDEVSEILPMPEVTPLPEALPGVRGAAFVGGRLTTVVDTASLLGESGNGDSLELLLRMAPPHDHLALPISSVEFVLPFEPLKLKEEEQTGMWRGVYPWGENFINVIQLPGVAEELTGAVSSALHVHTAGREHGA